MNNTFLEYGKKGNSKELMEILSHIFNRNNELSESEKKGLPSVFGVHMDWVKLKSFEIMH